MHRSKICNICNINNIDDLERLTSTSYPMERKMSKRKCSIFKIRKGQEADFQITSLDKQLTMREDAMQVLHLRVSLTSFTSSSPILG